MTADPRLDVPHPSGSQERISRGPELAGLDDASLRDVFRHAFRALQPGGRLRLEATSTADGARYRRLAALEGFLLREVDPADGALVLRKEDAASAGELPLVSIVIPTFKPRYFAEALASACDQTYPHTEIVVSDNCPTEGIKEIVDNFARARPITYFRNPEKRYRNTQKCFELSSGAYVKFLLDDDVLAPTCVRRMVQWFEACPDSVTLVTSRRQHIDGHGRPLPDRRYNRQPDVVDAPMPGRAAARDLLTTGLNFVGEMTTFMFPRRLVADAAPFFWSIQGREYPGLGDIALPLSLLARGDLVYLSDVLSYFRLHGEQHIRSGNQQVNLDTLLDWYHLVLDGRRLGVLDADADYEEALYKVRKRFLRRRKDFTPEASKTLEEHVRLLETELKTVPGASRSRLLVEQMRALLKRGS